ncbi:mannose-6-phosphate isomerase, class I [Vibrio bivalvicida]|uniref:mannose-6-phosphate isomerase n=1 Tax=Vibrio bivalvicida TaxID=1276888 RepID=A0A177XX40_9VIBR|nr:mannose-6-phosphate isomerase, class I [Vibrio bivalvicida]OAJ93160.1 mannose-6-phosphate isomerase [Vibrio bivalvicida]
MPLYKLENVIQNYAWGSKKSLRELFSMENPNNDPQAEVWMGAHPGGCSKIAESGHLLSDFIEKNRKVALGNYTSVRFGELPYLFKVLAAETPLSIQVHPNKRKSEIGFARENAQGIALGAVNRNYKDPNHKPELVYALTFYKAINGFRPIEHIVELFQQAAIATFNDEVLLLESNQTSQGLRAFFTSVMSVSDKRKANALSELYRAIERPTRTAMCREALSYCADFRTYYDGDIGLFAPLMLNTVELEPGEAMFLDAETPHAYVEGTGLEVMANSDNVLRAGLTQKHIDIAELIDNTKFESIKPEEVKLTPVKKQGKITYPIAVDDFCFDILYSEQTPSCQYVRSAEIVFCVEGEMTLSTDDTQIRLEPGESAFIPHDSIMYHYQGMGTLARVYN